VKSNDSNPVVAPLLWPLKTVVQELPSVETWTSNGGPLLDGPAHEKEVKAVAVSPVAGRVLTGGAD
jgi:hypothetical protein